MYNIYTASGKNQRCFSWNKKQEAFNYYNSIKHIERTELHLYFIAIFPENLYILESDRKQADFSRKQFLKEVTK